MFEQLSYKTDDKKHDFKKHKLITFMENIPLPATAARVVDGAILYINEPFSMLAGDSGDHISIHGWVSKSGGDCPECVEPPAIANRRYLTSDDKSQYLLVGAVRVAEFDSALIRIYAKQNELGSKLVEKTLIDLINFIRPSKSLTPDPQMMKIAYDKQIRSLSQIVDESFESEGILDGAINNIPENTAVNNCEPLVLNRVTSAIINELKRFESKKSIVASIKDSDAPDTNEKSDRPFISFSRKGLTSAGKSRASEVSAMSRRLDKFCKSLAQVTGFSAGKPVATYTRTSVEINYPLNDCMEAEKTQSYTQPSLLDEFSPREKEIIEMVRDGLGNDEISDDLGITNATIKQHLKSIFKKAGVKKRVDLVFKLS